MLAVRPHGETSAILSVFTETHGRQSGVLRGGASRKMANILQPGTQLSVEWRARLEEHIGNFRVELVRSRSGAIMSDRLALGALVSACSLLEAALPEREPNNAFYGRTIALLDVLTHPGSWFEAYLHWELMLLENIGFGLELGKCAATGTDRDLAYVSPRTGRAVSREGAGRWADKLLPLPACFLGGEYGGIRDMADGLKTTQYFLERGLVSRRNRNPVPRARVRFADSVQRRSSGTIMQ